ncbi:MAG: large conductance mechanosensitive channel [Patescibacteria group bacterium]|nr:large conductance mechanosensitive channel [Patescibacteria group bacterium]
MAEKKHVKAHETTVTFPAITMPKVLKPLQGFVDFLREQGVVGLAIGIVLGAQIKSLVDSFVFSFINPLLGLILPGNGDLGQKTLRVTNGEKVAVFTWGAFVMQFISFAIVAALVYFVVHGLKLDKLTKKKEK